MHPGGISDKVGNRYEAVWLVRHLVELIDGKALSVAIELLGDEGAGFEFKVERPVFDEWHQCKRQMGGNWTINRLADEHVLQNFMAKLAHTSSDICRFVSTDPAPQLKRLQEKLPSASELDQFKAALSIEELGYWQTLCRRLDCDEKTALDWLQRTEFLTFPETELRASLKAELERWFGSPATDVFDALRGWIEDDANFNRPLLRADLETFLRKRGIGLKQYEFDRTVPGKLDAANAHYDASYRPIGAGLFDIDRGEVDALVAALDDPDVRAVALAGPAGSGKSVIIRKALSRIAPSGQPVLVFRVDEHTGVTTLGGLGEAVIEIDDSPAIVLEQLAGRRQAVLVIDQADAVSEVSGRSGTMRGVLLKLLAQARHYVGLKVVFSCRSFDLENDHGFRELIRDSGCQRIDISLLSWDVNVLPVAERLGIAVDAANPRIRALLCQPIGLAIAAELARDGPVDLAQVEHLSQLYDRLLELRDRELRTLHRPGWTIHTALTAIAAAMSEREQLVAPCSMLDCYPGAVDLLQQAGLVVAHGRMLALMHESLFDYLHARSFVGEGKRLEAFLLSAEQSLFRRTQVRQILSFKRELDRAGYLIDLAFILSDERVRLHVRDLVARWLSTIADPSPEEWQLVLAFASGGDGLPFQAGRVIFGNKGWGLLLDRLGLLDCWFAVENDDGLLWVLRIVERMASTAWQDAARLFDRFLDCRPEKALLVLRTLGWFEPDRRMPSLADVVIRALALCEGAPFNSEDESPFNLANGWVKHAPDDAGRIVSAILANWYRVNTTGSPFGGAVNRATGEFYHIGEFLTAAPATALAAVLPAMRIAMDRLELAGPLPREDELWHYRSRDRGAEPHNVTFLDLVRSALHRVAVEAPERVHELLAPLDPKRHMTALHLLLEAVSGNVVLAPLLADQVDNPGLFDAGWYRADAWSAGKAMATCWPELSSTIRGRLEARLMALRPELECVLKLYHQSLEPEREGYRSPAEYRRWARWNMANSSRRQWSTFRQMGEVALSRRARSRFAELERKFIGCEPEEPDGMRSGSVRSPIALENARHMNDAAWLRAMTTDWSTRQRWQGGDRLGGAGDLSRVLHEEVKANPARFLTLYWRMPPKVAANYFQTILRTVAESRLEAQALDDLLMRLTNESPWQPDASTLLCLIERRAGEEIRPKALATLRDIAAGGETDATNATISNDEKQHTPAFQIAMEQAHHLEWRGRQAPRGSALAQCGWLACRDPVVFAQCRDLVDRALSEDLPGYVFAAAVPFLHAAIRHDPYCAVSWIGSFAARTPLTLVSQNGRAALHWLDEFDHCKARPLLLGFLRSEDPALSAFAAAFVFLRSSEGQAWEHERGMIRRGDAEWRAAAAHVAANKLEPATADPELDALVAEFFRDDNELVREAAADVFRRLDVSAMALHADLYRSYLDSASIESERSYFLRRLEDAPAEFDPFVLELMELVAMRLPTMKDKSAMLGYRLWGPLMRIYTSREGDAEIRRRCLDVIDTLIANDVGGSDKLQEATR